MGSHRTLELVGYPTRHESLFFGKESASRKEVVLSHIHSQVGCRFHFQRATLTEQSIRGYDYRQHGMQPPGTANNRGLVDETTPMPHRFCGIIVMGTLSSSGCSRSEPYKEEMSEVALSLGNKVERILIQPTDSESCFHEKLCKTFGFSMETDITGIKNQTTGRIYSTAEIVKNPLVLSDSVGTIIIGGNRVFDAIYA